MNQDREKLNEKRDTKIAERKEKERERATHTQRTDRKRKRENLL